MIDFKDSLINNPLKVAQLSSEQITFLKKNNIHISGAYIGLLRAYRNNKVIWQTSCYDNLSSVMLYGNPIDDESLALQLRNWINDLMILDDVELEKVFNINRSLLS